MSAGLTIDRVKVPTDSKRTLARLRLCRMRMRREGSRLLDGRPITKVTDVRETWVKAGWEPPA